MNRIYLLFLLLICSCGEVSDSLKKQSHEQINAEGAKDLKFDVPHGWVLEQSNFPIVIHEDLKNNTDNFNESIIVDRQTLAEQKTFQYYVDSNIKQWHYQDEGLMVIASGLDTIYQKPVFRFSYRSYSNNGQDNLVQVDNFMFVKQHHFYTTSVRYLVKNSNAMGKLVSDFIQSIQL